MTNVLDICLPFLKYLYRCLVRWLTYSGINNGYLLWATIHMLVQVHLEGMLPLHYLSWLNEPTTNRRLFFFSASITHPNWKLSISHFTLMLSYLCAHATAFHFWSILMLRWTNLLGNHIPFLLCATFHILVQVHMQLALPPHGLTWIDEPMRKRRFFLMLSASITPIWNFWVSHFTIHISDFTLGILIWSMDRTWYFWKSPQLQELQELINMLWNVAMIMAVLLSIQVHHE